MEANIGGNIRRIEKLRRWRPMWRVDFTQDGADAIVLVRGMRPWESIPYSLEHEMKLMQVLEAHGIHVPHVYGMMPSPTAFVLRSEEHTSELQSLMRISYAVIRLQKKKKHKTMIRKQHNHKT